MPEVREVDGFGDVKQGDCGSTGRWGVQRSRPYGRKRQWMRKLRLDAFYFGFPRAVGWSGLVWSGLVGQGPVQLQASRGEAASARQANGLDEAPIAVDGNYYCQTTCRGRMNDLEDG